MHAAFGPPFLAGHMLLGMENTQRIKLIAAALAAAAFIATDKAKAAPLAELCWATLSEIRLLMPRNETACMLRVGQKGLALSFTTSSPLFEDPVHGKAYMAYLFGSLGKSLNKSGGELALESVQVTNPALLRSGQAFHVQADELKSLQREASNGKSSVSGFYDDLLLRGRLVRTEN
jgi:hypothetical protein